MAGILTHEQKQLAFRLRGRGWRLVDIAREVGCTAPMVGLMVRDGRFTTGLPDQWQPRPGCLGITDREEILVGIRAGDSLFAIAVRLRRVRSTISREVAANGGRAAIRRGLRIDEPAMQPDDRRPASSVRVRCSMRSPAGCKVSGHPMRSLVAYRWTSRTIRRCG